MNSITTEVERNARTRGLGPASGISRARGTRAAFSLPALLDRNFRHAALLPALLLLVLISAFPIVYNAIVSFQAISLSDEGGTFVGFKNYAQLAKDSRFWAALGRTGLIMMLSLAAQVVLGVALALFFAGDVPGKRWFVALMILPAMISPIVAGAAWRLLFDARYGPVNQIISWFAGYDVGILWTVDARFAYPAVLIVEVWQHTPFVFLLTLAALESMDRSTIEAAQIDGARRFTMLRHVVLPAIWPVLAMVILIRALDLMRLFEIVWALTRGGPGTMTETISIYIYRLGFEQFETSYTAAAALVLVVVLAAALALAFRRVEMPR
jgi:multiple sugar transport system permease protein